MSPCSAVLDVAYVRLSYPIFCGNSALRAGIGADGENLLHREFRTIMRLSVGKAAASFAHSVGHVVGLRTKEQVCGIDARRRVATMARNLTGGNWPSRQFPRQSMRSTLSATPSKPTIAVSVNSALPQNAPISIGMGGIICEAFRKRTVTWAAREPTRISSHFSTSNAVVGQGRCRRYSVARPAHFSTNGRLQAMKSRAAEQAMGAAR